MQQSVRAVLRWATLLAVCLPLAALLTIVLSPFWWWAESTFGVEALGHSGPAGWCYAAAYFGLVALFGGMLRR